MEDVLKILWQEYLVFASKIVTEEGLRKIDRSVPLTGLQAPNGRKIYGKETGFLYESGVSPYELFFWSSALDKEGMLREKGTDYVWLGIRLKDTRKRVYFSAPFKRTKGLFPRVLTKIKILKKKIDEVPICPVCLSLEHIDPKDKQMKIYQNTSTNQTMYVCKNKAGHTKTVIVNWDAPITDLKDKQFLDKPRKARRKQKQKDVKAGITRTPARFIRKRWKDPS